MTLNQHNSRNVNSEFKVNCFWAEVAHSFTSNDTSKVYPFVGFFSSLQYSVLTSLNLNFRDKVHSYVLGVSRGAQDYGEYGRYVTHKQKFASLAKYKFQKLFLDNVIML